MRRITNGEVLSTMPMALLKLKSHMETAPFEAAGLSPATHGPSSQRVDGFVAQGARNNRYRNGLRLCPRDQRHQRTGAFLAGAGGKHKDRDIGVAFDQG